MKITLCGSIAFYPEMLEAQQKLESLGHEVKLPLPEVVDGNGKKIFASEYYAIRRTAGPDDTWVWERKAEAIHAHFEKVSWSDAIVVVNPEKRGVAGYIGANTLMEMGLAFHLRKPIYLLYRIPELPYTEEIRGMHPTVLESFELLK